MPLQPSSYVDPNSYVGLVNQPGSVSVTNARTLCLVGIAPRVRRYSDEAVIRGKVYYEALTAWSGTTPFRCVLANPSNRDRNNAVLYKNAIAIPLAQWSFVSAALVGNAWAGATIDVSLATGLYLFTMAADGRDVVTIDLEVAVAVAVGVCLAASILHVPPLISTPEISLPPESLNITSSRSRLHTPGPVALKVIVASIPGAVAATPLILNSPYIILPIVLLMSSTRLTPPRKSPDVCSVALTNVLSKCSLYSAPRISERIAHSLSQNLQGRP